MPFKSVPKYGCNADRNGLVINPTFLFLLRKTTIDNSHRDYPPTIKAEPHLNSLTLSVSVGHHLRISPQTNSTPPHFLFPSRDR